MAWPIQPQHTFCELTLNLWTFAERLVFFSSLPFLLIYWREFYFSRDQTLQLFVMICLIISCLKRSVLWEEIWLLTSYKPRVRSLLAVCYTARPKFETLPFRSISCLLYGFEKQLRVPCFCIIRNPPVGIHGQYGKIMFEHFANQSAPNVTGCS